MWKSEYRRASQSRPLVGKSVGLIQSPCSRHRIFIRVSARLQATAAPEAPEPMMSTSTISSVGRGTSGSGATAISGSPPVNVPPHPRPAPHRVQQRPVALLDGMSLGERGARLKSQRDHHAIIAVVALQYGPTERGDRRSP